MCTLWSASVTLKDVWVVIVQCVAALARSNDLLIETLIGCMNTMYRWTNQSTLCNKQIMSEVYIFLT